jgi:hypothetical protein
MVADTSRAAQITYVDADFHGGGNATGAGRMVLHFSVCRMKFRRRNQASDGA